MKKKVMNKSGVSAVVATVLIIMITVAAVGIIWAAIIPMVKNSFDSCKDSGVSIVSQGYTCYDSVNRMVAVQVKKSANEFEITSLTFLLSSGGNSYPIEMNYSFPASLNSYKTFYLNVSSLSSLEKVEVVPYVKNAKDCGAVSMGDLPECDLGDAVVARDVGEGCVSNEECSSGVCAGTPKVCRATGALANGEFCNNNAECQSSICGLDPEGENICVSGLVGTLCLDSLNCLFNCISGLCSDGSVGSNCNSGDDCSSVPCILNKCSDGSVGSNCNSNIDCDLGFCNTYGFYYSNILPNSCTDGEYNSACGNDNECKSGLCGYRLGADVYNRCSECGPSTSCIEGSSCVNGACSKGEYGSYCMNNDDCDMPLICSNEGDPENNFICQYLAV